MSPRRFVSLDYELLENAGYIDLSSNAKVVLEYAIKTAWTKKGNSTKRFIFGHSDMPKGMIAKSVFFRAMQELLQGKFLILISRGTWPNRKSTYALSEEWKNMFMERSE